MMFNASTVYHTLKRAEEGSGIFFLLLREGMRVHDDKILLADDSLSMALNRW